MNELNNNCKFLLNLFYKQFRKSYKLGLEQESISDKQIISKSKYSTDNTLEDLLYLEEQDLITKRFGNDNETFYSLTSKGKQYHANVRNIKLKYLLAYVAGILSTVLSQLLINTLG